MPNNEGAYIEGSNAEIRADLKGLSEALIDASDLRCVLAAIASVCEGKAEHLRSNWQDASAGAAWDRIAFYVHKAATRAGGEGI